ncbi:aspartate/glutamate racemase family protein [Roseobacter sp.]|uniref:aspartate/glutamate racemase family protein n=1 Tax=Roseobacter sp. TaxID=1907202 RepID=UPI00385E9D67
MMNICIITPIITKGFRDAAALHDLAPTRVKLTHTTLAQGPASVESAVDEVLAGPGVVDAAYRAEADGAGAIVIDCMLDPALEAAREAVSRPVVGCGEAGLTSAAAFGRFSVVTVLQRQDHAFFRLAAGLGVADRLVSVLGIGVNVLDLDSARDAAIAATVEACKTARDQDGAEAIVFGCTGMLGYAKETADALGWPEERVIDPLPNAIRIAAAAVEAGQFTDKLRHPFPEKKCVVGFEGWSNLHDKLAQT